ncbi:MAG TPA: DinB family protein [Thermoanaerobaculia bacterium]|nr:DinB family protein [Thermoanaerobaculia bacterium]
MDGTETLDRLRRLFAWDAWANRETLAALRAAGAPPDETVRLLAHVVGTGWLWWARLRREPSPTAVWPELGLPEIAAQIDRLEAAWNATLDGYAAAPGRLAETVPYVNSQGEAWSNRAADVLEHAVLHGAHHRGQIAAALRRAGAEPPYTDWIHAVRRGLVP